MINNIKDYVKTKPRLYDILKLWKRRIFPTRDPVYEFFNVFSKSYDRDVTFVQIGANEGLRNDPIREFIIRDKWKGIFVEPLTSVFDLLRENYSYSSNLELVFVNAAISSQNDDGLTFYTFDEDFLRSLSLETKLDCLQKASFERSHLERHLSFVMKVNPEEVIKAIKVPCLTMDELMNLYWTGEELDLLVIDAETHESEIIRCIDFKIFSPKVIFFESHNLASEKDSLFQFLNNNGYSITEIGGDALAINENNNLRQ